MVKLEIIIAKQIRVKDPPLGDIKFYAEFVLEGNQMFLIRFGIDKEVDNVRVYAKGLDAQSVHSYLAQCWKDLNELIDLTLENLKKENLQGGEK